MLCKVHLEEEFLPRRALLSSGTCPSGDPDFPERSRHQDTQDLSFTAREFSLVPMQESSCNVHTGGARGAETLRQD